MGALPRALALALVLLGVAPAVAAPGEGVLELWGSISLPANSTATLSPLAVYAEDATLTLTLRADHVEFHRYAARPIDVGLSDPVRVRAVVPEENASYPLRAVEISLSPSRGWWGLYPAGGELGIAATHPYQTRVARGGMVGNSLQPEGDEPRPDLYVMGRHIQGTYLHARPEGSFTFEGGGALKVHGGRVDVDSADNSSSHMTGSSDGREAWVFVRFSNAEISWTTTRAVDVAAQTAACAWEGRAQLVDAHGEISTDVHRYLFLGGPADLSGELEATLVVDDVRKMAHATLTGDIEASTARAVAVPPAPAVPARAWLPLIGLALIVGAAAGAALLRANSRGPLVEPRRLQNAVQEPGRAAYLEALVHAAEGRSEEAVGRLRDALDENPALLDDVIAEEGFGELRERTDVQSLLEVVDVQRKYQ